MTAEPSDPPDGEKENERAAQEFLAACYLKHHKWLRMRAHRIGKGQVTWHDAWDLSQTAFVRFYEKLLRDGAGPFVEAGDARGYLETIIRNLRCDEIRNLCRGRNEVACGDIEEMVNVWGWSDGGDYWGGCTEDAAISAVLGQQMRDFFRRLPGGQGVVMEELIQELDSGTLEAKAVKKIAEMHDLSEDAVRGLKKRALANLRMYMGLGDHDA